MIFLGEVDHKVPLLFIDEIRLRFQKYFAYILRGVIFKFSVRISDFLKLLDSK